MTAEPMKTKHIKITNRTARELRCILAAFITWLLPALVLILTIESSLADSATWVANRFERGLEFPESMGRHNWTGNVVPNGPDDTATFASSSITSVFLSAGTRGQRHRVQPGCERVHDHRRPRFRVDHQRRRASRTIQAPHRTS